MTSNEEISQRVLNLQKKLQLKEIDGALIIYPIDLFYFSGTGQNAVLWVPSTGDPVLFVRKSFIRAQEETAIIDIRPFSSSKVLGEALGTSVKKIGITFDVLPIQQYNYYSKILPGVEFIDISSINKEIRSVKSSWEIEQMKNSANKLCQVFAQVPDFLKPGMREIDLAIEFEYRARKLGHEGFIRMRSYNQELFFGHFVSGSAASYPGYFDGPVTGKGVSNSFPQGSSLNIIEKNAPILVDYVGVENGYMVDMTRIFSLGPIKPEAQNAFDVAISIQDYLVENLKPGNICSELFEGACDIVNKAGLGSNFMGIPGEQVKFVGHGIGLELDELPVIALGAKAPLQVGQTIALEPKFVFPDLGVIGIENTFAVGPNGGERITLIDDAIKFIDI